MQRVQKTTVYLGDDDYRRLKVIARELGRRPAELVREAVAEFARTHDRRKKARSVGSGRSGRGDISERAEELLSGLSRGR
jgi:predicted transcriptional regulator